MKFKIPKDGALIALLLLCFLVRLYIVDYPIFENGGEASRDFLVASHIAKYHEYPLVGPYNGGTYNLIKNSPVYYYLMSLPLFFENDIFTLIYLNILLQLLSIALIYKLADKLFGQKVAILAGLLFAFTPEILRESNSIWPPYVMQPFANLSYLFLLTAYLKKSPKFILLGLFMLIFAIALHNSALAQLPLYLILSILISKNFQKRLQYIKMSLTIIFSFIFFYFPIFFANQTTNTQYQITSSFYVQTLKEFFELFINNLQNFGRIFHFTNTTKLVSFDTIFVVTLSIASILYFYKKDEKNKRMFTLIIIISILTQIISASLLPNTKWLFYISPIFGLFCMLIAKIIFADAKKDYLFKAFQIVIIIFLLITLTFEFVERRLFDFSNTKIINSATQMIKEDILEIQMQGRNQSLNFFQVRSYIPFPGSMSDALLWVPLEKEFKKPFTKVSDENINNFEGINEPNYIFLGCFYYQSAMDLEKNCRESFLKNNIGYFPLRQTYSHSLLTIYLFKRLQYIN